MRLFKNYKEFESWFFIVLTPIFLSVVPFLVCWVYFGYRNFYFLFFVFGLVIGLYWANYLRKKRRLDEYDYNLLLRTPDIVETWEKEKIREEKEQEVTDKKNNLN